MSPHPQPEPADPTTSVTTLRVDGLDVRVGVRGRASGRTAVQDVSLTIGRGEAVGLVGESGSGKTLTCRSILGLLPPGCRVDAGSITLGDDGEDGAELVGGRRSSWQDIRGTRLAAVFQDPASYLNPSITVGHQLAEVLRVKGGRSRHDARRRALELFAEVGLHLPERVYHQYPQELSGGMLQRILLAIAVSLEPELLVADEATTALDVVIQAEILRLLSRLRRTHDLSLLLVTHDLAVVAETCDRVLVMYAGEIVESGPTAEVLANPRHPYTRALLGVASIGNWSRRALEVIPGSPPEAGTAMPGCRFAPRCRYAAEACTRGPVALEPAGPDRAARCVRLDELASERPAGGLDREAS
ncbi:MAG: ABC transporter ATP-binding protein [Nocardioides sp.]